MTTPSSLPTHCPPSLASVSFSFPYLFLQPSLYSFPQLTKIYTFPPPASSASSPTTYLSSSTHAISQSGCTLTLLTFPSHPHPCQTTTFTLSSSEERIDTIMEDALTTITNSSDNSSTTKKTYFFDESSLELLQSEQSSPLNSSTSSSSHTSPCLPLLPSYTLDISSPSTYRLTSPFGISLLPPPPASPTVPSSAPPPPTSPSALPPPHPQMTTKTYVSAQ